MTVVKQTQETVECNEKTTEKAQSTQARVAHLCRDPQDPVDLQRIWPILAQLGHDLLWFTLHISPLPPSHPLLCRYENYRILAGL